MAVVRCFMMQKNEKLLLETWIKYYARLFGIENLTVLDDGSDDPVVIDILHRYAALGLRVLWEHRDFEAFKAKGEIIRHLILQDDEALDYDFALPLDCDEFLVACGQQVDTESQAIHAALERLKPVRATLSIDRIFLNIPHDPGFFITKTVAKSLFRRRTIAHLDHGFHQPFSIYGETRHRAPLGLIHLHNKPLAALRDAAASKLGNLIDIHDEAALRDYSGPGHHLKSYFSIDEDFYINRYKKYPNVYIKSFLDRLDELGADMRLTLGRDSTAYVPSSRGNGFMFRLPDRDRAEYCPFDEAAYLEQEPDVAQDGVWPLYHYTYHGYFEGRSPVSVR